MMPRIYFKRDKSRTTPKNINDTLSDGLWYVPGVGILSIQNGQCVSAEIHTWLSSPNPPFRTRTDKEMMEGWQKNWAGAIPIVMTITKRKIKIKLQ